MKLFEKNIKISPAYLLFLLFILLTLSYKYIADNKIISDKLIEPEIKLKINNNQVDTIYIYRQNN